MILLDSDILIDIARRHPPAIAWLDTLGSQEICLPGYVVMEYLQGCQNASELAKAMRWLSPYDRLWPNRAACEAAVETFSNAKLVSGLSIIDALIAHTAIRMNLPLHTFNIRHYAAVPGLQIIQPYTR